MNKKIKDKIYSFNYKKIMHNIILFESNPDFSDNTRAVFDEMLRRNYNDKFKLIWFVDDEKKYRKIKIRNVKFITYNSTIISRIRCGFYNLFAKYIIDCNKLIYKRNKDQIRFYLSHGAIIKEPVEYFKTLGNVDYILEISDIFKNEYKKLFNVKNENIITLGFPRNDYIFCQQN